MPRSRVAIDAAGTRAKLDSAVAAMRGEAEGAEADPFDDAMVAAIGRLAEAVKAEATELQAVRERMVRLARRAGP